LINKLLLQGISPYLFTVEQREALGDLCYRIWVVVQFYPVVGMKILKLLLRDQRLSFLVYSCFAAIPVYNSFWHLFRKSRLCDDQLEAHFDSAHFLRLHLYSFVFGNFIFTPDSIIIVSEFI